jgi:tetratricopeptide (TPR) repeat protein
LLYLQESLAIYRELKDTFWEILQLEMISWMYQIHGHTEQRVKYTKQRLSLAQKLGAHLIVADATANLGFVDEMAGRYTAAEIKYEQALPIYLEYEYRSNYAGYLSDLAGLVLLRGDLNQARKLIGEAEVLVRQLSNPVVRNIPYGTLGMIHNLEENYSEAIRQNSKDLDVHNSRSFVFYQPKGLAYAHCGLGDFSSAKRHLREALDTAIKNDAAGWQVQCLPAAALIAAGEEQLERAVELLSLAYHQPAGVTGWLEIFPLVTHLRTRLKTELPTGKYAAAWERGENLDLAATVMTLLSEYPNEALD